MLNNKRLVMMIDDNEIDLKINSKVVTIAKLFDEIIICMSGTEGMDYLNKHIQNQERLPGYILLDIQMPDMNGFDFLEQYKRLPKDFTANCQVIMLSSSLDFGDIKRAEANPYVVKLLRKPLSPTELAQLL
ncbi:MAG: response regulator [Flavobacterium sp.]|nr:MAG: response regulator [Flavobacterium sp.]